MSAQRTPTSAGSSAGILHPSDPVTRVPGVGISKAEAFSRLGVVTVEDLLRLAPRRFEDRRVVTAAAGLLTQEAATWIGRVVRTRLVRARGGLAIVEVVGDDETGEVSARWFNQPWLAKSLVPGARILLHGPVRLGRERAEFVSAALERLGEIVDEEGPGVGRLVPVYPATTGLSVASVRRATWTALPRVSELDDPIPAELRAPPAGDVTIDLPALSAAIRGLHFPRTLDEAVLARARLAFDELLVHEILLARRRATRRKTKGIPFTFTPTLHRRIRGRLPFALTPSQDRAVTEVVADLEKDVPMHRLLQGDVGAGKTLVAAYACLACVANGRQAAFMAPTEILARQHEATMTALLSGSEVRIETLTGTSRGKARSAALARVAEGTADLVLGTHAVLSKDVRFSRLGLVVVDEQHKFGVRQRHDLVDKGPAPHCLVMTATPIPRSLAMVVYGDLDLTAIEGLPPGRGPRETWIVEGGAEDRDRVMARVHEALARTEQVFVVYPLVTESDKPGLRDATAALDAWRRALPERRVGLVHGKMKAAERMSAMDSFRRGETDVLVATVVIEAGIDVPNATVLVVEHAERFGLSQLHQLRGRVGRGKGGGLCVLVDRSEGETPDRLRVLEKTDDGFRIADEDLRLRGAGDPFGTRQHGAPGFASARFPEDLSLLRRARSVAASLLERDPGLTSPGLERLSAWVLRREEAAEAITAGG